MVTESEIKQIAGDAADQVVSSVQSKNEKVDQVPEVEEPECHCDNLKPMADWLAEPDQEGEQCHECITRPIGELYMGALEEAKATLQLKTLEEAWETQDLLTIGKAMDKIKNEVGDPLKKRLTTYDCLAQTYKPEAVVDEK